MDCSMLLQIVLVCYIQCVSSTDYCEKGDDKCTEKAKRRQSNLFKYNEDVPLDHLDVNNFPPLNDPRYVIKDGNYPTIVYWTDNIYPHENTANQLLACPRGKCIVTTDREQIKSHLTRGFIFYGTSLMANDLPLPRLPHHEWALLHEESPKNHWMYSDPLGISLFNHTATFRRESDYTLSTHFIPDTDEWFEDTYFVSTEQKNQYQREEDLGIAVFVQRDCNPPSDRDTYIKELMKHMKIDSYGTCVNNKKMPEEIDGFVKLSSKPYYHFLARYKFQIAFENCLCHDYMTEKLFRPLCIGSVPVYFGSSGARDFMPNDHSVIMAEDFETPKHLADYLIKLNNNNTLYEEYLAHRKTKTITNHKLLQILEAQPWKLPNKNHKPNFGYYMFAGFSCHVCDKLHQRNEHLKNHLENTSHPILPPRMADNSHMGCPIPVRSLPSDVYYNKQTLFKYGAVEAKALSQMLHANETDTTTFVDKYLGTKTDKYP